MGIGKLRKDERIPNLASEFKSDNIWPPFGQKSRKLAIFTISLVFDRLLAKKGLNVIRRKFWDQIWNPLIIPQLSNPIWNDLHILTFRLPIAFHFKNDFWARSNRNFSTKRIIPCYSAWKDTWEPPRKLRENEKVGKMNHPSARLPSGLNAWLVSFVQCRFGLKPDFGRNLCFLDLLLTFSLKVEVKWRRNLSVYAKTTTFIF